VPLHSHSSLVTEDAEIAISNPCTNVSKRWGFLDFNFESRELT